MSRLKFPLMLPGGKLERRVKVVCGLLLLKMFPRRAARLVEAGPPGRPGLLESMSLETVCEIGCGSGLVLADVAEQLPSIRRFIGLDLSVEQTTLNRLRFADRESLQFESGNASDWIPAQLNPGVLIFTNAGVLEYFPPDRLRRLLACCAGKLAPVAFVIVEPIYPGFDCTSAKESMISGGENSYSHPYGLYFEEAGFEIFHQEEVQVDGYRWLVLAGKRERTGGER